MGEKTQKESRVCQCTVYFHSMAGRLGVRTGLSSDTPRLGWDDESSCPLSVLFPQATSFAAIY